MVLAKARARTVGTPAAAEEPDMMNFLGPIVFGIICIYFAYVAWFKPNQLKQSLENIYNDSWPTAKAIASSGFIFWLVRIFTFIMFVVFLIGLAGITYDWVTK